MLIQPTGKDISSDSSESACCGGTYGSGGSGGFGISITVPSGKLFSSSEVYLETNNEKHKNICQLNNDCISSWPLKKKEQRQHLVCAQQTFVTSSCTCIYRVQYYFKSWTF